MPNPDTDGSAQKVHRVSLDDCLATPSQALHEFSRLFRANEAITIFDIGCCEGEDSIRYSRHFPHARIFSFEALPANQEICRQNFELYRAARVELVPVALCDRSGTIDFHVSSGRPEDAQGDWNYGNKSSSVLPPKGTDPMFGWVKFQETITVPCTTLDQFCQDRAITRIDLIHMDVQGAESLVLAGGARILPSVGAIWLEVSAVERYAGQKLRDQLHTILSGAGFWMLREFMRPDGEGDELWLNRRSPRSWVRKITAAAGDAKYFLFHRHASK